MTIDMPKKSQIPQLKYLWQQAFGDTEEFLDRFFSMAFAPERSRCVTVEDTVASALYWFDCNWGEKKVAYVYAVATDEAFQGKGYCRSLLEDTHRQLKQQGYAGGVLVPGEESLFRFYEKSGYQSFCPVEKTTFLAAAEKIPFRQISATEYAALEKKLAPKNSILHQASSLAFGSDFMKFYAGEGFVFCCSKEENRIQFQEFLGDPETIPGILHGLQADTGTVALPGGNDFAMYCPLDGNAQLPHYFAIAFN